ncbi:MAG: CHRD domain-containing protein [Myxococcota bacterium]
MSRTLPLIVAVCLGLVTGCAASPADANPDEAHGHAHGAVVEPRAEVAPLIDYPLNPKAGTQIGLVFEAYLSPQQEADEESDTPAAAPSVFKSTKPPTPREERPGRGHGTVAFTKDFSRAYAHLAVTDIDPKEIVMAHIHCGKPGMLGPIIVDFGKTGDVSEYFADGVLSYEITNRDLERVIEDSSGVVGAFTGGCPINWAIPNDRVRTIAGMAVVAGEGQLYYNIHTASQTFYGDIRGQLHPVQNWQQATASASTTP